jgi:hypothetical protein
MSQSTTSTATTTCATPTPSQSSSGLTSADWVTRDDMVALTRTSADTIARDMPRSRRAGHAPETPMRAASAGGLLGGVTVTSLTSARVIIESA